MAAEDPTYGLRISKKTKIFVSALSPMWKKKLNHEIRLTMAKVLHEANFTPWDYLDPTEDDERPRQVTEVEKDSELLKTEISRKKHELEELESRVLLERD